MELKVLPFYFQSCSFPEGHLYETVPAYNSRFRQCYGVGSYSAAKPMKESTWGMLSLKIWVTNTMRTGNHRVQQTQFHPKLKTHENIRQGCAWKIPVFFSETNLALVSLDMFHSTTPSAFQQLGLVHFFFLVTSLLSIGWHPRKLVSTQWGMQVIPLLQVQTLTCTEISTFFNNCLN